MTIGYISIGSNIERNKHIAAGVQALHHLFGELVVSSVYEADAVGFPGAPFYNLVVGFNSELDVHTIAQLLRKLEFAHGRPADSQKFSARTLDLDLLLYGDTVINDDSLQLPRPDIERYAFVLEPLAEIAPDLQHPLLQQSYAQLWAAMAKTKPLQWRVDVALEAPPE